MTNRKLQSEIDRTLKKIGEGIEEFDSIFKKIHEVQNQNLKEKHEADLKKEIKKLQRFRDQIKTQTGSNDVKDKAPLIDARKQIEIEMERFKVCEKEMKIKAYSKEALLQAVRNSAESSVDNQKKCEANEWLDDAKDRLKKQLEKFEVKQEKYGSSKRKKKFDKSEFEAIQSNIDRHNWHISKIEHALKRLNDDLISTKQIDEIRDSVEYFIESNQDPDFFEDEFLYDPIEVDSEEKLSHVGNDGNGNENGNQGNGEGANKDNDESATSTPIGVSGSTGGSSSDDASIGLRVHSTLSVKAKKAVSKDTGGTVGVSSKVFIKRDLPKKSLSSTAPVLGADDLSVTKKMPKVVKKKQQIVGNVSSGSNSSTLASLTSSKVKATTKLKPGSSGVDKQKERLLGSSEQPQHHQITRTSSSKTIGIKRRSDTAASTTSSSLNTATSTSSSIGKQSKLVSTAHSQSPSVSKRPLRSVSLKKENINVSNSKQNNDIKNKTTTDSSLKPSFDTSAKKLPNSKSKTLNEHIQSDTKPDLTDYHIQNELSDNQNQQSIESYKNFNQIHIDKENPDPQKLLQTDPTSLQSEHISISKQANTENVQQSSYTNTNNEDKYSENFEQNNQENPMLINDSTIEMLNTSLNNLPIPQDSEKKRLYFPRNPHSTPPYFNSTPLHRIDDPRLYSQLDIDTLFFIFYFQQGTYQQYMAARELKRKSQRYHKKYLTQFQRHEEPKFTSNDYEKGTYVYFDYDSSQCQRIKSDFIFQYGHLEDELMDY